MQRGASAILVCLCLCCTLLAQGLWAQSASTVPLRTLFERIESKENINFSYALEQLADVRVDTTFVKTWDELKEELIGLGFQYRMENESLFLIAPIGQIEENKESLVSLYITDGNEPLVGANVVSPDGRIWVSDDQGKVALPKATVPSNLTVRYVGYVTERVQDFSSSSSLIAMRRDTMLTAAAEVVALLPTRLLKPILSVQSTANSKAFNTQILPPVALNSFGFTGVAGVNTLDGQSALPAIRGSQGTETLVELDGLPLYHIDHFFGLFSAINQQAVAEVNLYRSHYPADRGGFRGGLMDVQSVPGSTNSAQFHIDQLSAAATVTGTAGPIRVLASARSSLGNVAGTTTFQEAGAVNDAANGIATVTTPDFSYYDMYAKIDVQPSGSRWSGMLNGFASMDEYSYGSDSKEIIDDFRRPISLEGNYLEQSAWQNLGFSGSLHYRADELTYSLRIHRTDYEQRLDADAEFSVSNRVGSRAFEVLDNALQNTITDQQVELSVRGGKVDNSWSTGVQGQFLQTQARFRFSERTPLDVDQSGNRLHAFGTRIQPLGKQLSANFGLRATQAFDLDRAWLSPRIILSYALPTGNSATDTRLHAGYSYTRQSARALQHENQFGQTYTLLVLDVPNRDEQPQAHNLTFGYTRSGPKFKLDIEGYYRKLPGLIATLSSTIGINNDRVIAAPTPTFTTVVGEGEVLGVDLDFQYDAGPYSGQVAYTLSKSIQSFRAISQGTWQRAPDDRRHRLATSHTYRNGRWSGGFNLEAASGLVYNDLNAITEADVRADINPADFQERLPAYQRLDMFGRFEQPFGKTQALDMNGPRAQKSFSLGLRLYNVLDRANVTQRQYILNLNTDARRPTLTALGTDVALLGRVLLVEVGVRL